MPVDPLGQGCGPNDGPLAENWDMVNCFQKQFTMSPILSTNCSSATGTGTLVTVTTTANSRPTNWGTPANWSNGTVPTTGDEVELEPPDDANDEDEGPDLIIDA